MPTSCGPTEQAAYPAANPDTDTSSERARLRREMLALRRSLEPVEHARLSAALEAQLALAFAALPPGVLAFCWPIRGEFDARPLVCRLLAAGWRAVIPTVTQREAPMTFRAWTPATPMGVDPFGIPVPVPAAEATPDVLLLPLVAFDDAGYRLGYGGGYFDRTLVRMVPRPQAWGVGFDALRIATLHPQAHDIRLDAVITESGVRSYPRLQSGDFPLANAT